MPTEVARGQRQLSEALGVSKGTISKLRRLSIIDEIPGQDGVFDVDACRRALAAYRRGEKPAPATPESAPAAPPPAPRAALAPPVTRNELMEKRLVGELEALADGAIGDDDLDKILRSSRDLLELAHAGALKAARGYAGAPDEITAKTYQASLDVLRKAKNDDLEYRVKTGELIERDVAKACMGELARGFVLACDRLGVRIASQYELWHTDPKLNTLGPDDRARKIRAWVDEQTDQARVGESSEQREAEIEQRVAAEISARTRAKKREGK